MLLDALMPEMDGFALAEQIKRDPELAGATIMMLSSADRSGDAARCRELGVACYLRKPIKQSDLFDAILTAAGRRPVRAAGAAPPGDGLAGPAQRRCASCWRRTTRSTRSWPSRRLQKRGHTVVVAGNGREALAAFEREAFDLVLMDVQMPEMDGFEATAAIRRARDRRPGGHVPIVAMTAHAMKGDRERCLAAGMDAYVSKPLRVDELFEAIARLVPAAERRRPRRRAPAPAADERPAEAVFDPAAALARVEGDRELLRKMIGLFFAQAEKLLPEIRGAGERGDGKALERAAHKLKGSMGSFGAAVRPRPPGGWRSWAATANSSGPRKPSPIWNARWPASEKHWRHSSRRDAACAS